MSSVTAGFDSSCSEFEVRSPSLPVRHVCLLPIINKDRKESSQMLEEKRQFEVFHIVTLQNVMKCFDLSSVFVMQGKRRLAFATGRGGRDWTLQSKIKNPRWRIGRSLEGRQISGRLT